MGCKLSKKQLNSSNSYLGEDYFPRSKSNLAIDSRRASLNYRRDSKRFDLRDVSTQAEVPLKLPKLVNSATNTDTQGLFCSSPISNNASMITDNKDRKFRLRRTNGTTEGQQFGDIKPKTTFPNPSGKYSNPVTTQKQEEFTGYRRRFFLKPSYNLETILSDPKDRRIRSICDRFQCDLEIYAKTLHRGCEKYIIDISSAYSSNINQCARALDSSMKWCISSQTN